MFLNELQLLAVLAEDSSTQSKLLTGVTFVTDTGLIHVIVNL
jgi:hypothetical protein